MGKRICIILAFIISIFLVGCTNQDNKKPGDVNKKEKAPETLTKVSDGIDELLTSVDSIVEITELTELEFQAQRSQKEKKEGQNQQQQQQQSGGGNGGGQSQDQGQGGQNQENQNGQQQQQQEDTVTKGEELFLKWREVDKKLEEIHEGWNSYEVESLEKGANQEKGNEFKKNLNNFTVAVEKRQIEDIMNSGSRATNSLAVFFDLYKDEIRGDLSRVKYSVHQAFLQAQNGNIQAADNLLKETEEYTSRIRQKLEEDKSKDLEKLSLSISDMKLALQSENIELLKIKRDIVIKNIKSLQE